MLICIKLNHLLRLKIATQCIKPIFMSVIAFFVHLTIDNNILLVYELFGKHKIVHLDIFSPDYWRSKYAENRPINS